MRIIESRLMLPEKNGEFESMKQMNPPPTTISSGNRGFSLVELLIVVMIILLLSAMAVPSYLGARARANEASAAAAVRSLIEAQNLYRSAVGSYASLDNLGSEYITDNLLLNGRKAGYYFDTQAGSENPRLEFTATAVPVVFIGQSATGRSCYYGDATNVIRFRPSDGGDAATVDDPPLR